MMSSPLDRRFAMSWVPIVVLAVYLWSRLFQRALALPLSNWQIVAFCLGLAAWSAGARAIIPKSRRESGIRKLTESAISVLVALSCAIPLSIAGNANWGLFFGCLCILLAEALGRRWDFANSKLLRQWKSGFIQSARTSRVRSQSICRRREDGIIEIRGRQSAPFDVGQRYSSLHVAFAPAFGCRPRFHCKIVSAPDSSAQFQLGQLLPIGARIDVKLAKGASQPGIVEICYLAQARESQTKRHVSRRNDDSDHETDRHS